MKYEHVYSQVEKLYATSQREAAHWMWANHVVFIFHRLKDLTQQYGGDLDLVLTGALLHDLGDVWFEREDEQFEGKTQSESLRILNEAGFDDQETDFILNKIIAPHSCYPENIPSTLEGKLMATADALAHLETDFYMQFCWMHLPPGDYQAHRKWASKKIERDYHSKIFFDEIKSKLTPKYQALKLLYSESGESN